MVWAARVTADASVHISAHMQAGGRAAMPADADANIRKLEAQLGAMEALMRRWEDLVLQACVTLCAPINTALL